jgi:CHAD domain-containing protein
MLRRRFHPADFVRQQVETIVTLIPSVRDANAEAIHDARIATRRLRAALPILVTNDSAAVEDLQELIRTIGRALGRVREADATICVIDDLQTRTHGAHMAIAAVRQAVASDRERARRTLVKEIDRADINQLPRLLHALNGTGGWLAHPVVFGHGGWETKLAERIRELSTTVHEKSVHASGVFLPNRIHRLRIASKKLRYALEIAAAAGHVVASHMVRDVKRVQNTLGRVHDVQVLANRVEQLDLSDDGREVERQRRLLIDICEADCLALHRTYLERRRALDCVCAVLSRNGGSRRAYGRTAIVATAMVAALPAALAVSARRR